jgi:uncharacterized protein YcbX
MTKLAGDHPVSDAGEADPHLAHVQRFPVKSLDPETRERATLTTRGALDGDREWAILDRPAGDPYDPESADVGGSGDYVNGKKTAAVHRIRSTFHPREADGPAVTLRRTPDGTGGPAGSGGTAGDARRFRLYDGRDPGQEPERAVHAALDEWLSAHFGREVSVRWDGRGQHDDRTRHGPTVVSTATLREVAAWFDVGVASARRRFRANLEVGGVPPFWEDRLFGDEGDVVAFRVGEATVHGVHPCQRCIVPARDPDTGTETPAFRATFVRRREETLPPWTPGERFDHPFRLMVNTRVPDGSDGTTVEVGDGVEILGPRSER